jgi:dTMP kinase
VAGNAAEDLDVDDPASAVTVVAGGGGSDGADDGSSAPRVSRDEPGAAVGPTDEASSRLIRIFGSKDFFRLWLAQVLSSTGDWIGFVAIVALATRLEGAASGAAAVGVVMSARLIPGFFFAPVAGVLVDRWDRKRVMVICDLMRGAVLATLPFVNSLWGLVVASLALEVATLLWSPAKEASVPNLVPTANLTTANSLSLAAAYGTFPVASLLFAGLAKVAEWLGAFDSLGFLRITDESVAFYFDLLTFVGSAALISTLSLTSNRAERTGPRSRIRVRIDFSSAFRDVREGWRFMFSSPTVRAVMVSLSTGLIGGGVVPLGDVFSRQVLGGGSAGFGLLLSALGFGMAGGVLVLSAVERRLPKTQVFTASVFGAGLSLVAGASMSSLTPAMLCVALLGVCAGSVYVLGFTILHESVADELRGRIFSSLNTLVRFCLLLAFAVGPVLADRLGALSQTLLDGGVSLGSISVSLPGARLALWLAGSIIVAAGFLAVWTLRAAEPAPLPE